MIKRVPWLRRLKKTDPEAPLRLPIACGPVSNGEGWWPDSARKRLIRKLVREKADEVSRKEGIDRREFMASACGMATTLYMINLVNGCTGGNKSGSAVLGGDVAAPSTGAGSGAAGTGAAPAPLDDRGGTGLGAGAGGGDPTAGTGGSGGFGVPADAMTDVELAECAMGTGGNELIIDMQSHFATPETNPFGAMGLQSFVGQINNARFPWIQRDGCSGTGCYDRTQYINQILIGSDTTIGVLSGISYSVGATGTGAQSFAALTNEDLLGGAAYIESQFPGRILTHCMVMPSDRIDLQLAMMDRVAGSYTNWKTYPPWGPGSGNLPDGYWLHEDVGPRMIQRGLDLGSPVFCIHKGFPLSNFSPTYTGPSDVGPAAKMFPGAYFVIYHSAFEHGLAPGQSTEPSDPAVSDPATAHLGSCPSNALQRMGSQWPEGPYDESDPAVQALYPLDRGVNSLIKSLRDNDIGPNGTRLDPATKEIISGTEDSTHVYAECGSTWPCLMTGRVEEAMHYWGKLLKHVGEDHIVWGTDCLWFGSPQPVIEAFRCFEISQEFQDRYGYPALTPARKLKILGHNAARIQAVRGLNVVGKCHSDVVGTAFLRLKRDLDEEFGKRRDMIANVWGPRTRREFLALRAHEDREKHFWSGRLPARGSS